MIGFLSTFSTNVHNTPMDTKFKWSSIPANGIEQKGVILR